MNKGLNDRNLSKVLKEIRNNKSLKTIDLSYNNITSVGFAAIMKQLCNHPRLEHINLKGNKLGDNVIKTFDRFMNKLKKLTSFDLSENSIKKKIFKIRLTKIPNHDKLHIFL